MCEEKTTADQVGAFTDAVIAVNINIIVLELQAPEHSNLAAPLPLCPTVFSYAVIYVFIAIIWLNHHHLLRGCSLPHAGNTRCFGHNQSGIFPLEGAHELATGMRALR
jgi:Endosomal/lysosomal potassium channel TMEM175